jgi:hypothetical protein
MIRGRIFSGKYKVLIQIVLIILLTLTSLITVWVITIPTTPTDAHLYAEQYYPHEDSEKYFVYAYPYKDYYRLDSIELDISEKDFNDCLNLKYLRYGTVTAHGCGHYLSPTDKNVMKIAERISERTEGLSIEDQARTVMNFVKHNIVYQYDCDLWGTSEYWATPTETLYLKAGDCEDRAILAVSIFIAMGLDGALLDYDGHIAPAIRYPGESEYRSADFCYDYPSDNLWVDGKYPKIYNSTPEYSIILNKFIGSARYFVKDTFGI